MHEEIVAVLKEHIVSNCYAVDKILYLKTPVILLERNESM